MSATPDLQIRQTTASEAVFETKVPNVDISSGGDYLS